MGNMVINPIQFFPDLSGLPLDDGSVYIGSPNTNPMTNPVSVYQDDAMTVPMSQPLRTTQGAFSINGTPIPIYIGAASYSMAVLDKGGNVVMSLPAVANSIFSQVARVVNSIAALRALPSLLYSNAFVTSYYGDGRWGGGAYQLIASTAGSYVDNGGTIIIAIDGGVWQLQDATPVSIGTFGAKVDGATSDDTAWTNALAWVAANGREIHVEPGTSIVTSGKTANFNSHSATIRGAGKYVSCVQTTAPTGDVFAFTNGQYLLSDLEISSSVTRTAGAHVNTNCSNGAIQRVFFNNYFYGVNARDNTGVNRDCDWNNPSGAASVGVYVNGYAGGLEIDNALMYVPTNNVVPLAGIQVVACGACIIANSNIISQGTDLLVNPASGQNVSSLWAHHTFFDTAIHGVHIVGATGTNITRLSFDNIWASSHSGDGFIIDGTVGFVDGIEINAIKANLNGGNGITLTGTKAYNTIIRGGQAAQNAGSGFTAGVGCTEFFLDGLWAGDGFGLNGNAYGIFINTGCTQYTVRNCQLNGNTLANMNDGSNAGTVTNNVGFMSKNSGASLIASGGSSVVVNHGLSAQPPAANINVYPIGAWGSDNPYVDTTSVTATQFTVRCVSAAPSILNFGWRATCSGEV